MQIIDITTAPRGRRSFDPARDDFGPAGRAYALAGVPEHSYPNGLSSGRGLAAVRTPFGDCVCAASSYCGSVSFGPAEPSDYNFATSLREMIRVSRETGAPVLYRHRSIRPALLGADDLERMLAEHEEHCRTHARGDGYLRPEAR